MFEGILIKTYYGNFGGFTIFTDRPFGLNDRVRVAGFDGTITEIGVRSTRLQTLEGRIVTIPNSKFSDSPVENVSLEPSRKVVLGGARVRLSNPNAVHQIGMIHGHAVMPTPLTASMNRYKIRPESYTCVAV